MQIAIERTRTPKAHEADESKLGFGKHFTDHMFLMRYDRGKGWHDACIKPYGPLSIDPASPVLHYAQEIFEGLKAYRQPDGGVALFRPIENARRLNNSAERLEMPPVDEEFQVEIFRTLVDLERSFVPTAAGTSLYLRPTCIADGGTLGVHAADSYLYFVICSPSGAYYAHGLAPVRIRIESKDVRAVRGGVGFAKTGGNYAASLRAGEAAKREGFDQVLWLDGRENRYIEEVGAMNIMFVIDGTLVTPVLNGSILPGITRKTVLELAREQGLRVEERRISVDELMEAAKSGALTESFGTGTAAVISPIGAFCYDDVECKLGDGTQIGPVSRRMYDTITGIQRGLIRDEHNWLVRV